MNSHQQIARRALAALDLTSLDELDTPTRIRSLCERASTTFGKVAAVCVYPEHIFCAKSHLAAIGSEQVKVATVVNFPDGSADAARAERETRRAISAGADEIDLVFPWQSLRAGDARVGADVLARCRAVIPMGCAFKVILETGELSTPVLIRRAADLALANGADFLKTSTGKVAVNATPAAVAVMIEAIAEAKASCGIKVAGGVRKVADAQTYFDLVDRAFGSDWATPARFRIGASGLLDDILAALSGQAGTVSGGGY